jgi:hypothetical protein
MLIAGVGVAGAALGADLEASLDRTRILEGETVLLTLSAPGDSWGIPELGALAGDFDVKNEGQSTRMTIVNGRASSTREWRFLLAPKRSGHLTIPVLRVGDLSSEPIELEVLPAAEAAELDGPLPVMLEVEVDDEAPYVQGQVIYRVRVLARVSISQATLEDPSAQGVIIQRMGEDKTYETDRDGQRFQVIERRYAIFPQHSGELEIASPVLAGRVPEGRDSRDRYGGSAAERFDRLFGRDPFEGLEGLLQRTRPIQVRGPTVALDVRPQPAGSASPWLPAESLELAESWAPEPSEWRVGEPVTRTVAITAQGLTAAQLPDLTPEPVEGLKVYPDKPRSQTRAEGDAIVSIKETKLAMVPSSAGELTIPQVRVEWWDTGSEQKRVAVLPARVVEVLPAIAGQGATVPAAQGDAIAPDPAEGRQEAAAVPDTKALETAPDLRGDAEQGTSVGALSLPVGYWPWIAATLGGLWLITLGLLVAQRRNLPGGRGDQPRVRRPRSAASRSAIKRACEQNDPKAARDALLLWGAAVWPEDPPRRLETLSTRLNGQAGAVLQTLDRSLYAGQAVGWDGAAAWERLAPALSGVRSGGEALDGARAVLPPLYPNGI